MSNPKWFDSVTDWIAGQVKEAATDIRRRVVEEPWFEKTLDGPAGGKSGEGGPSVHMKVVNSETTYNKTSTTSSHEVHFSVNGSAWDWKPDPRATEALQKPSHDLAPEGPEKGQAKGQDKGIDL